VLDLFPRRHLRPDLGQLSRLERLLFQQRSSILRAFLLAAGLHPAPLERQGNALRPQF
jgi:hypothetical protein